VKRFLVKGIAVAMLGAALAFPLASPAFALTTPTTGQPGASDMVSCGSGSATMTPGSAGSSPGAPFNGALPGQADTVYAGNPGTASLANSNSTAAVSQYDVACLQVTTHQP
jgi:hypothetical protein